MCLHDCGRLETDRGTGRAELLQHVGDKDLEQSLPEETLPHRAAVIVKFLPKQQNSRECSRKSVQKDTATNTYLLHFG